MSPVERARPLPEAQGRGKLLIAESVLAATSAALQGFAGQDGRHEGIVLWLGRFIATTTMVVSVHVPEADHGWGHVRMSEQQVGTASRSARALGLGIIAQVHSHPGTDVRHSDGDDDLVLMPFEGMFSLVVGRYGDAALLDGGLHQYQDGVWHRIIDVDPVVYVIPPVVR